MRAARDQTAPQQEPTLARAVCAAAGPSMAPTLWSSTLPRAASAAPSAIPSSSSCGLSSRGVLKRAAVVDKVAIKKARVSAFSPVETPEARALGAQVLGHRRRLAMQPNLLRQGGQSRLEMEAVGLLTKEEYKRRLAEFDVFCDGLSVTVDDATSEETLEMVLLEFFDHAYLNGGSVDIGTKVLAALGDKFPRWHRSAAIGRLPRARRALQGWLRLSPLVTRLPLPWMVLAGLACSMARLHHRFYGLAAILAADAYLRPGELANLKTHHVIKAAPELGEGAAITSLLLHPFEDGKASKTHVFNESVALDSLHRRWLGPLVDALAAARGKKMDLFPFTQQEFARALAAAAKELGLESWQVTPYILRHTGPSDDYLLKVRSIETIKKRGRWMADSSVRRYEKSSRVNARLLSLPRTTQQHCQRCLKMLADVLAGRAAPPPLPPSLVSQASSTMRG